MGFSREMEKNSDYIRNFAGDSKYLYEILPTCKGITVACTEIKVCQIP